MSPTKRTAALCLIGAAWLAAFAGANPPPASVPPTQEIEVFDPNVHPQGLPKAIPTRNAAGVLQIDIPETVLVHKYYYTGDRTFQTRFLPGGPCIVVANHPKTGERMYIPVQMLPGAPRVHYTSRAIEYDYGNQGITVQFGCLPCKATVAYRNHPALGSRIENAATCVKDGAKNLAMRTGVVEASQKAVTGAKNVTVTTVDHVADAAKVVLVPIQQAAKLIPGIKMLTSSPEDQATRLRDAELRAAQTKAEKELGVTLPTNR